MMSVLLLFIHCLLSLVCVGSLLCGVVLGILSSAAIILLGKRELVALL